MIPAPHDVLDHLTSASDPVERAVLCTEVAGRFRDLHDLVMRVRSAAMLEAYEHHGTSIRQLADALGITPARTLTVVTEARRSRDRLRAGSESEPMP